MTNPGQERTKAELQPFPRGPRGSGQNMFRMILWMLFRNFYSASPWPDFPTRESVIADAIAETRKYHPGFTPEVA